CIALTSARTTALLSPYTTLFRSRRTPRPRPRALSPRARQSLRQRALPPRAEFDPNLGAVRLWTAVERPQAGFAHLPDRIGHRRLDRKSTRLNSSHVSSSYAVFCL